MELAMGSHIQDCLDMLTQVMHDAWTRENRDMEEFC